MNVKCERKIFKWRTQQKIERKNAEPKNHTSYTTSSGPNPCTYSALVLNLIKIILYITPRNTLYPKIYHNNPSMKQC